MREFRPSLRNDAATTTLLAFATWLVLRVALRIDPFPATLATTGALASVMALRLIARRSAPMLGVTADGIEIHADGETRRVAWTAMDGIHFLAGYVDTANGTARVRYAQITVVHGAPLAFSDLSSVGAVRLLLPDERTPILDVGAPDVLLGIIAGHIGEADTAASTALSAQAGPDRDSVPTLLVLRVALMCLLTVRFAEALWDVGASLIAAAVTGGALVVAVSAMLRVIGPRVFTTREGVSQLLTAMCGGLATGIVAYVWSRGGDLEYAGSWALAAALVLALPSAPMPGGALARSIGARAAQSDHAGAGAVLISVVIAICAVLLARGMTVLPLALLVGAAEGVETFAATRREKWLAGTPDAGRSHATGAGTRPGSEKARAVIAASGLHNPFTAAAFVPRTRWRSIATVVMAIALVGASFVFAHRALHGGDPNGAAAIRTLLR